MLLRRLFYLTSRRAENRKYYKESKRIRKKNKFTKVIPHALTLQASQPPRLSNLLCVDSTILKHNRLNGSLNQ